MKAWIRLAAATCLAAGCATGAQAVDFTGVTGSGRAFSNMQPSLVMASYVQDRGIFPSRPDNPQSEGLVGLLGSVRTFAFASPNYFSAAADGRLLSVYQNSALFALYDNRFGGNGNTTFGLPNLAGTTVVGAAMGQGPGQRTGSATVSLTNANLPAHGHGLVDGGTPAGTTGISGQAAPAAFVNRQPSLSLNYGIAANGYFNTSDDLAAIGQVVAFGSNFIPNGYLAADGRLLRISEFQALYARIGNLYGGDGRTTFALPNLIDRTIVGSGASTADRTIVQLGQVTGQDATTLTLANLPVHTHDVPGSRDAGVAGGGAPIAQEQASIGLRYMISVAGVYPSRERAAYEGMTMGEVITFAGLGELDGYLEANGQLLNIAQYQALFSLLGVAYGGDGVRTFALPDLRGRAIIGNGSLNGVTYNIGQVVGSRQIVLDEGNLPAHQHSLPRVEAPVPEPATWAAMLLGFAVTGAAMRRRRTTVRVALAA